MGRASLAEIGRLIPSMLSMSEFDRAELEREHRIWVARGALRSMKLDRRLAELDLEDFQEES